MSRIVSCVVCFASVSSGAASCPKCGEPDFCTTKSYEEAVKRERNNKRQEEFSRQTVASLSKRPAVMGVNDPKRSLKKYGGQN
jgi:hypothetical protein